MYIQPSENALNLLRQCACSVEIDEVPEEFVATEKCTHMTFWTCPQNGYQFNLFKFNLDVVERCAHLYDFKFMSDSQCEDRARYEKFLFVTLEAVEEYCRNYMFADTIKIYTEDFRVLDAFFMYDYKFKIHIGASDKYSAYIGHKSLIDDKMCIY